MLFLPKAYKNQKSGVAHIGLSIRRFCKKSSLKRSNRPFLRKTPLQMEKILLKSEPSFKWERVCKFKAHAIVTYGKFTNYSTSHGSANKPTQLNANSLANLEKVNQEGYNGYMSDATRRHVKGILENLLIAIELNTSMKFPFVPGQEKPLNVVYPTFVTLSLPFKQMHDDNDLKREVFGPFMQELIRNWNVRCYVWVAETQKNGNIHFHILMDRGIPAVRLRQIWNKHLDTFDYVKCFARIQKKIYEKGFVFREEMFQQRLLKERERARELKVRFGKKEQNEVRRKEENRQKEAYEKGKANGWRDPNSTDIHSIQNVKKLTAYITKYMTKMPKMIEPILAENQRLVQENGKHFIVTKTIVPESTANIYGKNGKIETITVPESTQDEKVIYTTKFETRKLRGRIWGAAERLKNPETKPCPYTLAIETYTEAWNTYHITTTRPQTLRVPTGYVDLFGNPEYKFEDRDITHEYERLDFQKWPAKNKTALSYLEILEAEVPPEDIAAATLKAGALFASEASNKVIPLREPQKTYLQKHSPSLWENYCSHYRNVFETLYADAA